MISASPPVVYKVLTCYTWVKVKIPYLKMTLVKVKVAHDKIT